MLPPTTPSFTSRFPWDFSGNQIQERLAGLSSHSANATLYYDDSRFSLRGSLAWRSQYISAPGSALNVPSVAANQNGNLFSLDEPEPRTWTCRPSFKITKSIQGHRGSVEPDQRSDEHLRRHRRSAPANVRSIRADLLPGGRAIRSLPTCPRRKPSVDARHRGVRTRNRLQKATARARHRSGFARSLDLWVHERPCYRSRSEGQT